MNSLSHTGCRLTEESDSMMLHGSHILAATDILRVVPMAALICPRIKQENFTILFSLSGSLIIYKGETIMNMDSLSLILTVAAFIVGIMLLTGHGEIFMKGGNADVRKKLYDEKKMEKGCGWALIAIGVVSAVDMFTTSLAAEIGYIVAVLIIIIVLVYYLRVKCKK